MKLIHYISNIFKRYKKNIGDTSVYNANELVDFFAGNKQDNKGRYITTYLKYDPKEIEQFHDFIQWAFPTSKPSEYNPDAPIIDDTFAEHLQENSKALENYCSMCHRYLNHIGLDCNGKCCKNCSVHENEKERVEFWQIKGHNFLRITRLLQSLCESGNHLCSRKVYEALLLKKEAEFERVYYGSLRFWKETQDINDQYLPYLKYSESPISSLRLWALRTYYKYRIEEYVEIGSVHGITHWDRVYENGKMLLGEGVNENVVATFAYTHDVFRRDDGNDYEHGPRASEMIVSIRNTYLSFLNDDEFALLSEACKLHTTSEGTDNPTLNACFDSDRLDLGRVGITPDPDKMCSVKGRHLAKEWMSEH